MFYRAGWIDYIFQDILGQKFWQYNIQNAKNFVVNLPKPNLNDLEISLLLKRLNFVLTCNNIDNTKFRMKLDAFGRMLQLKLHFRNEKKNIHRDMFKSKPKFNPHKKNPAIELHLSSLE